MMNAASMSVGRMPTARRQAVPAFPSQSPQATELTHHESSPAEGTEIVSRQSWPNYAPSKPTPQRIAGAHQPPSLNQSPSQRPGLGA